MELDPYQVDSEEDSDDGSVGHGSQAEATASGATVAPSDKKKKPFWAPKHIAYVKGLPYSVTPEEYEGVFKDCGETISITEKLDDENKWTGCLFVRYASEEGLKNCIAVWNEAIWTGAGGNNERYIKVQRHNEKKAAKKKKSKVPTVKISQGKGKESTRKKPAADSFKVVVSNLKKDVSDDEIRRVFAPCGEMKSLKTSRDKAKGSACKGYCHIEFKTQDGMAAALAANLKGRVQGQLVSVRLPGVSQSEVPLIDIGIKINAPTGSNSSKNDSNKGTKRKREKSKS